LAALVPGAGGAAAGDDQLAVAAAPFGLASLAPSWDELPLLYEGPLSDVALSVSHAGLVKAAVPASYGTGASACARLASAAESDAAVSGFGKAVFTPAA
jgi:hypothetical protein